MTQTPPPASALPCALTVAGSDSSGGAGIQADLRTFAALHVYGASAITALTVQNTRGVSAVMAATPAIIRGQIDAVLDDLPIGAVKTGMLGDAHAIEAVVAGLAKSNAPVVVDPVMIAKSGAALLPDDAIDALRAVLLPRAALVTPNLPEAARLLGFSVRTPDDQLRAARALLAQGAKAALVKGGHGDAAVLVDVLVTADGVFRFVAPRLQTRHTHGTGCTFSAAIAASLARGFDLVTAVGRAHAYVHEAIRQAPGFGGGHGPLHHMHPFYAGGVPLRDDAEPSS